MSEDYELAVLAELGDVDLARAVRASLQHRTKLAADVRSDVSACHAAFETIEVPEVLHRKRSALLAGWTLSGVGVWEDTVEEVGRTMCAFASCGALEVFACLDASVGEVLLQFYRWSGDRVQEIDVRLSADDEAAYEERDSLVSMLERMLPRLQ